ncbi:MAG: glycosyltransferase family 2 protein [bacterium]
MRISFFFPVYNDEMTVRPMVEIGREVLGRLAEDYEIIIVDDCSPDKSSRIADETAAQDEKTRVVHHPENMGYGGALRSGFQSARFEWIFFTDGDMQYDVKELERFLPWTADYDMIVGCKVRRAEGFKRALYSRLFNLAVRILIGLPVRDANCAFKLIRREVIESVSVEYPYRESFYLIELMYKAIRLGYRIKEVPVSHYKRPYGESSCLSIRSAARHLFYVLRGFMYRISGRWN